MASVGDILVRLGLNVKDFQQGLKTAESAMTKASSKFKSAGDAMSKAITVPMAAIGGIAIKGAVDVEKSQGNLQASLGVTGKEAEKLQGVVKSVFNKGIGENMDDVTRTMATMKQTVKSLEGVSTKSLEKTTISSLNMSKQFGADSSEIGRSVNTMQSYFKDLSTTGAFDYLTKGFQGGLNYSGEFLDTVSEYSPAFQKMGFSAGEMFKFFQTGAESGVFQLDKVGDLVKEMNIRFSDNTAGDYMGSLSKGTQQLYKDYQKTGKGGTEVFQHVMADLAKMDDQQEAYRIGQGLMGTQFEDLDMKAVAALGNVRGEMEGVSGTTERMNEAMNKDLGTVLSSSFRQVATALAPVGQAIGNLITTYLPPFLALLGKLSNWFTGLSTSSQGFIVAFAAIAAVIPPILTGLGFMVGAIGNLIPIFTSVGGAVLKIVSVFSKLRTVMSLSSLIPLITSPVGIIIGVLAGLIAIGILVYKNWDTIKSYAISIWGSISSYLSSTWSSIKSGVSSFLSGLGEWFSNTWNSISSGVSSFLSSIGEWFSNAWDSIKTTTVNVFSSVLDWIITWGSKLISATPIGAFVEFAINNWNVLRDTTKIVFQMIIAVIRAIFLKLVSIVSPVISSVVNVVTSGWNKLKSITSSVFNAIKSVAASAWRGVIAVISPIVSKIGSIVSNGFNKVKSITVSIFNAVKSVAASAWHGVLGVITPVVSKIGSIVSSGFNKVKSITSSVFNSVKSIASSTWNGIKSTILRVAGGISSGVSTAFNKVKSAMLKPVHAAKDGISTALGKIKSLFSNLVLKIPKPKLPHISVSKGSKKFLGQTIPIPKFDVSWNAKGNIFTGASILGGGQGVGEAGAEVVMPIQRKRYMKPYASMVADLMHGMTTKEEPEAQVINQFNISSLVVREEADIKKIAEELERKQRQQQRAKGTLTFA